MPERKLSNSNIGTGIDCAQIKEDHQHIIEKSGGKSEKSKKDKVHETRGKRNICFER